MWFSYLNEGLTNASKMSTANGVQFLEVGDLEEHKEFRQIEGRNALP